MLFHTKKAKPDSSSWLTVAVDKNMYHGLFKSRLSFFISPFYTGGASESQVHVAKNIIILIKIMADYLRSLIRWKIIPFSLSAPQ